MKHPSSFLYPFAPSYLRLSEAFEKHPNLLSPLRGGRCHGVTEGGSADNDQIGLPNSGTPSAFGISPARGEKGSFSKLSACRGYLAEPSADVGPTLGEIAASERGNDGVWYLLVFT